MPDRKSEWIPDKLFATPENGRENRIPPFAFARSQERLCFIGGTGSGIPQP